jgi:hypothetical protein
MFESNLVPSQIITLGLATHDHSGELWTKIPQKNLTHEQSDHLHWELIDSTARVDLVFPSLTYHTPLTAEFLEWVMDDPQLGWGGVLAKIKIKGTIYYVVDFLVNCTPLPISLINPSVV